MSQVKYLDLQGLKTVFGVVDSKIAKANESLATKEALQAVEAKVDAIDVEGAIEDLNLEQYAKSADVENTYAKKTEIPSLEGYATEEYVDSAIEEAKEAIVGENLKDALDTLETVKEWKEQHGTEYSSLLEEVSKKANSEDVASTYATKEELEGYQVKGDYALKSDIPTDYLTEEDIEDFITEEDLAPYAKTADLDTFVALSTEEIQSAASAE